MPEPKKRKSHRASRLKRAQQKESLPHLIKCPHCKELIKINQTCPYCGYFKGKKRLKIEQKVKTKIKEENGEQTSGKS